jgi:Penicillin amidase
MPPSRTRSSWQANPADAEVVTLLQRFSDGVNAYAQDVRAGRWRLSTDIQVSFDPERFVEWSPIDSLVLGRFQAFALSWTMPVELDVTEAYQKLRAKFDAASASDVAAYARRGISKDILTLAPVGRVSTIDGFPMRAPPPAAVGPSSIKPSSIAHAAGCGGSCRPASSTTPTARTTATSSMRTTCRRATSMRRTA